MNSECRILLTAVPYMSQTFFPISFYHCISNLFIMCNLTQFSFNFYHQQRYLNNLTLISFQLSHKHLNSLLFSCIHHLLHFLYPYTSSDETINIKFINDISILVDFSSRTRKPIKILVYN